MPETPVLDQVVTLYFPEGKPDRKRLAFFFDRIDYAKDVVMVSPLVKDWCNLQGGDQLVRRVDFTPFLGSIKKDIDQVDLVFLDFGGLAEARVSTEFDHYADDFSTLIEDHPSKTFIFLLHSIECSQNYYEDHDLFDHPNVDTATNILAALIKHLGVGKVPEQSAAKKLVVPQQGLIMGCLSSQYCQQ